MPQTRPAVVASRRDLAVQVGQRLAAARTEAAISQAAAAAQLGLAQSAIAKMELGVRLLTFIEALDLANLYGVDPATFDPRVMTTTGRAEGKARVRRDGAGPRS